MGWIGWSQAHRIPSRGTNTLTTIVAGTPGGFVGLVPDEDFKSEDVNAYEVGFRVNPFKGIHVDTTLFYDNYTDLRTFIPGPPVSGVAIGRHIGNLGAADNKGIELSATYQTTPSLRLNAAYSYHELDFSTDPSGADTVFLTSADKWPLHMWNIRSAYEVTEGVTWNTSFYYSDAMPAINIPAYGKLDTNVAWTPADTWEIIFGIDNITDDYHQEYSQQLFGVPTEVPRLYYVTLKIDL